MSKQPIWVNDDQIEMLSGYVGELLDDRSETPTYDRYLLDDVMRQLNNLMKEM